jgi:hypothetical protein
MAECAEGLRPDHTEVAKASVIDLRERAIEDVGKLQTTGQKDQQMSQTLQDCWDQFSTVAMLSPAMTVSPRRLKWSEM